eukprot:1080260-Alexandrium_andersonii.AAC.1
MICERAGARACAHLCIHPAQAHGRKRICGRGRARARVHIHPAQAHGRTLVRVCMCRRACVCVFTHPSGASAR